MSAMSAATTGYRKAVSEQRPVRRLAFHRLPPAVRRVLRRSLAQGGSPRPLVSAVRGARPPSARTWWFVALGAGVADLAAWIIGFGDRLADPALSPGGLAAVHAVALSVGLFAVLHAVRIQRRYLGVPYPPGRHLFELDLVEVDGTTVVVTPLDSLQRIEARPGARAPSVALVFTDGHEVVFEDQHDGEGLARGAEKAIEAARTLILPDDLARLEQVDPFLELRIGDDWQLAAADSSSSAAADTESKARKPLLERLPKAAVVGAAAAAGALAFGAMFVVGRQHLGALDEARYQTALGMSDLDKMHALEEYVAAGGRRSAEAEDELFELRKDADSYLAEYIAKGGPRGEIAARRLLENQIRHNEIDALADHVKLGDKFAAEADEALFQMAKERNSSAAFQIYLEKGRLHAGEVKSTFLPEAAFAEALKGGLPAPLLAFAQLYPQSPRAAEVKPTIHKMYSNALQAYVAGQSPPAAARRFFEAMLASIEARSDASVVVDVKSGDVSPVAAADKAEAHDVNYQDAMPYMDGIASGPSVSFLHWLTTSFPRGLVQPVDPDPDAGNTLPRFTITVTPEPSGTLVSQRESVRFTDVHFRIDFRATLPGRPEHLHWTATAAGLQDFDFSIKASTFDSLKSDRGDFARQVYGRMLAEIDRVFQERLDQQL